MHRTNNWLCNGLSSTHLIFNYSRNRGFFKPSPVPWSPLSKHYNMLRCFHNNLFLSLPPPFLPLSFSLSLSPSPSPFFLSLQLSLSYCCSSFSHIKLHTKKNNYIAHLNNLMETIRTSHTNRINISLNFQYPDNIVPPSEQATSFGQRLCLIRALFRCFCGFWPLTN